MYRSPKPATKVHHGFESQSLLPYLHRADPPLDGQHRHEKMVSPVRGWDSPARKDVRISSKFHLYIAKIYRRNCDEINRYNSPSQDGRLAWYVTTSYRTYVVFGILVRSWQPLLPRFYIGYLLLCTHCYPIYDYTRFCWYPAYVLPWLLTNR